MMERWTESFPTGDCWRVEEAERLAFLIDGEAYFGRSRRRPEKAVPHECIWSAGTSTAAAGLRRPKGAEAGEPLGAFLDRLARDRPAPAIYLLEWELRRPLCFRRGILPTLSLGLARPISGSVSSSTPATR